MKRSHSIAILSASAIAVVTWLCIHNMELNQRIQTLQNTARTSHVLPSPSPQMTSATSASRRGNEETTPQPPGSGSLVSFTVAKMWADPEFRKTSIQKNITSIEERYGRFFLNARDLPPEKLESIKLLLAEQSFDFGPVAMPASFPESEAELAARLVRMRALERAQENALKAEMGDDLYSRFQQNQATETFRGSVDGLANAVRARGFEVSNEEQDKILVAYASAMAAAARQAMQDDAEVPLSQLNESQQKSLRERQTRRIQLQLTHSLSEVVGGDRLNAFLAAQLSRDLEP